MNPKKRHINEFALALLKNKACRNFEYDRFIQNGYIIPNVEGNIDSDILNRIIRRAKWNLKLRSILTDMLFYTDGNSITNDNFQLLLHFARKRRSTYLCAISHIRLSFGQMQVINRLASSYEAFAWLFEQICMYDCFGEEDMLCLLKETSDITIHGIRYCIEGATEKFGESSKIDIAQDWVNGRTDLLLKVKPEIDKI